MIGTLFAICLAGGLISGLLGVGGAVVLIPLMLAVPPLVGVGSLTMHQVAGLTMIQVLVASSAGFIAHRRLGAVSPRVVLSLGLPMAGCSLAGAMLSDRVPETPMRVIFGLLIVLALVLMVSTEGNLPKVFEVAKYRIDLAVALGAAVGLVAGMVGAGGGFVLIPIMVRVLRIPVRMAVGSSLGIVLMAALAGALGKVMTLQVDWQYLMPVVVGSVPAALAGARLSHALSATRIRAVLVTVMVLTLVQTWWSVISAWLR